MNVERDQQGGPGGLDARWHDPAMPLVRLRQDLLEDQRAMRQCERELQQALRPDRRDLTLAGVALHWWFSSLELLLERVVLHLDRAASADLSDARLLMRLEQPAPSGRPPVLPAASVEALQAMRQFRREFRQGYAEVPEASRIDAEVRRLEALRPALCAQLGALDAWLEERIQDLLAA